MPNSSFRKIEALRVLAERPGTEAEGIVAREMLARIQDKRGEMSKEQFIDALARDVQRPLPTIWTCACGTEIPVGQKCRDSAKHSAIHEEIRSRFKKGDRVYYNRWAYGKNSTATVAGYCDRGKPDGHSYPWAWIRLKFDHLKNARAVPIRSAKGWHLSFEPVDDATFKKLARSFA